MRRKYGPGEIMPEGDYVRNDTWEIVRVPKGGALLVDTEVVYYRVPLLLVLLGAPIAGLAWFFVFPFLIPLVVGYVVFAKMPAAGAGVFERVSARFASAYRRHQGCHK